MRHSLIASFARLSIAIFAGLAFAVPVHAADVILELPVADARASSHATALLDIPFFMVGEKHPAVASKIGEWPTSQRTNALTKAKSDACNRVFISAILVLQKRAQAEGGNAIIDVRSNLKNQPFDSATNFKCAAGTLMSNVALKGTVVKLAGK